MALKNEVGAMKSVGQTEDQGMRLNKLISGQISQGLGATKGAFQLVFRRMSREGFILDLPCTLCRKAHWTFLEPFRLCSTDSLIPSRNLQPSWVYGAFLQMQETRIVVQYVHN